MEYSQVMQAPSAFTQVSVRRTFGQTHATVPIMAPSVPQPPSAAEEAKRVWPEAVRAYVRRAFASENEISEVAREEMEIRLKQVISQSAESNTLLTVDWANLPLPQQMILNERKTYAKAFVNSPMIHGAAIFASPGTDRNTIEHTPKKRKSTELESPHVIQEKIPPWRQHNGHNVFEDRISYPDKRQRNDSSGKISKSDHKLASRKNRFNDSHAFNVPADPSPPGSEADQGSVIGRCQILEKKYFRLTSAPNPDTVRPLSILQKTLELLKKKWKSENNYSYICDQFKSLRQDLTVQHIKTSFTVNVYEIHARIALEKGDLGEYNQCQTQLRALYSQHLGGHPEEFKAYRILYFIHTCNRTDMNDVLADLTPAEKNHPSIKHALATRSALALGNYHRFFKLYLDTPNMGAYLMDMFVTRERLAALSNICIS